MGKPKNRIDLRTRSGIITLLEKYSQFLEEEGYLDTDWKTEPPFAIDKFMETIKKIKWQ